MALVRSRGGTASAIMAARAAPARASRAAAAQPSEPELLFHLARCLDRVGKSDEARQVSERQQRASDDDKLPPLSDVFAAYGSWKRARRAAASAT